MEKVIFSKNGVLCSIWNQQVSNWSSIDLDKTGISLAWCLPYAVAIESGMTIREILNSLKPYAEQVDFLFSNSLMGLNFVKVLDAIEIADLSRDVHVNNVSLSWVAENDVEEEPNLAIYPVITGFTLGDDDDGDEDEFHDLYDLSTEDILNAEFVLDEWLEVYGAGPEPVLETNLSWTLYDFLGGLLSDLTLYAYSYNLIELPNGIQTSPIEVTDLINHIDDLEGYVRESESQ